MKELAKLKLGIIVKEAIFIKIILGDEKELYSYLRREESNV